MGPRALRIVLIRLGSRGDTYFSAGAALAEDDEGPLPSWPPDAPPAGGWWQPPPVPTGAEIELVRAEVASGTRSTDDAAAWAMERLGVALLSEAPVDIVMALQELAGKKAVWF
jgi:hypothetical protein